MDNDEAKNGVTAQIYTTLCVNLLTVGACYRKYDNLIGYNKTASSIGQIGSFHDAAAVVLVR